ncbi:MAG: hypothetical protein AAB953_02305, partial [Patescibacteria group bacterium]
MSNKPLIIGLSFFLLNSFIASAAAPSDVDPYKDGNLSVIKCIAKGGLDFGLFLDASIYNDSLKEGIVEPWYDVLRRNQCHTNDIYGLIKQQDKMRKAIRDSFLTCKTQKLPQLKKAFNKMTAEIYYVRHVINSGLIISLPFDIVNYPLFKKSVEIDRSIIYNEMYTKYVNKNSFTPEDFDKFFLQTESKYQDRKAEYINCEKGSWQAVGEKWNEFVKFFSEEGAGLKEAVKSLGAKAAADKGPSLKNEITSMKIVELFTTDESFTDYLGSFVQMNVNNLEPADSLEEVSNFLSKDSAGGGGRGVSGGEVAASKQVSDALFEFEKTETEMRSHFDTLYRKSGDESLELILNNLDGRNVNENDDGLLEIINNSFVPLSEMEKMT